MWLFFVMLIIHMVLFGNAQPTNATNVTSIAQSTPNGGKFFSKNVINSLQKNIIFLSQ